MSPANDPNVNDALSGLLGALLGGHPEVQSHMDKTGQSLDDVLGSISGSEAPAGGQPAPAMGDILGSLLGGGAPSGGMPSQGTGGDVLGSLLGSMLGGGGAPSGGMSSQGAGGDVLGSLLGGLLGGGTSAQGGMSMPSQQMPAAGGDPLRDSGLVAQLAQQSGLDQQTAAKSLQQAFVALGTQVGEGSMEEKQAELQTLLKKWK